MKVNESGVGDKSYAFFNTPSQVGREVFFHIKCLGHFYCDDKYNVKRDYLDSFLIMYVKNGEGYVKSNGRLHMVKANDIILLNCYEPHEYGTNSTWETLWIHFDGNMSLQYYNLLSEKFGHVLQMRDSVIIQDYIEAFLENFKAEKMIHEALISCNLQRMLAELLILSGDSSYENSKKNAQINDAIAYIRAHFKEKISLDDIASFVNLSPYHFSRTFKKELGYSPYEYLNLVRLNHSKFLLKNTKLRIKEIAFESGFNSESNFTTAFKHNSRQTPSAFRDMPF